VPYFRALEVDCEYQTSTEQIVKTYWDLIYLVEHVLSGAPGGIRTDRAILCARVKDLFGDRLPNPGPPPGRIYEVQTPYPYVIALLLTSTAILAMFQLSRVRYTCMDDAVDRCSRTKSPSRKS
jgi:hypothetical protein